MNISYRLLGTYIELPEGTPHDIAPAIAEHCFEVESIHEIKPSQDAVTFTNVFAARVISAEKHPNADRLRVVSLDLGDRTVEPVVCGAHNFGPGDMVALALPGAHIPQDVHAEDHAPFDLTTAKIRGVTSQGMICSGFELGLRATPEEKPEILLLPDDAVPGTDLVAYYMARHPGQGSEENAAGARDYLIETSIPANRPDLHSHIGVAQELSGMLGYPKTKALLGMQKQMAAAALPSFGLRPGYGDKPQTVVHIEHDACRVFFGARIRVRVAPTATDTPNPLDTLGYDGINNVVDITNFVMVESGQPLHAYDAAQVHGALHVRSSHVDEEVIALDAKTYRLPPGTMVVADDQSALGIAGIIGGNQSKITDETTEIILEVAVFDRVAIRRSSKAIGLRTDASGLFEKGTSIQQATYAFERAVQLLQMHASGEVLEVFGSAGADEARESLLEASAMRVIPFTAEQVNDIIGGNLAETEIKKILKELGIAVRGSKKLQADIPWYRQDIEDVAGIADELLRYVGMNVIARQPLQLTRVDRQYNREDLIWKAKDAAVNLGYTEVQGYSFVSGTEIKASAQDTADFIKISNPLSTDTEFLRRNLDQGLLKIAGRNAKHADSFKLVEIGFGYHGYEQEHTYVGFLSYGKLSDPSLLLAALKGDVETWLHALGMQGQMHITVDKNLAHLSNVHFLSDDGSVQKDIGTVSIVDPSSDPIATLHDLDHPVVFCQMHLDRLAEHLAPRRFQNFSRLPQRSIDLSIVVSHEVNWVTIDDVVRNVSGKLLRNLMVIDAPYLYPKNSLPEFHKNLDKKGQKNLVFRVVFGDDSRTLTDSEISEIYAKIKAELMNTIHAEIR